MRYKLLTLLSNLVAVADQGKKQDDSPVPQQMKKYLEETHSSQSSSDRQSPPPDEPPLPKGERMKTGTVHWSASTEATHPTQYVAEIFSIFAIKYQLTKISSSKNFYAGKLRKLSTLLSSYVVSKSTENWPHFVLETLSKLLKFVFVVFGCVYWHQLVAIRAKKQLLTPIDTNLWH